MLEDIKKYEPLWDAWYAEELIGQGSYGEVYKARRTEFGRTFESAVKIISIPQNEGEIRRLKLEGLDESSVRGFFYASVQDLAAEIDLMREFSGTSHIVSILDHMIVDKSNLAHSNSQLGWDILIRMELLKSLNTHVAEHPLSAAEVVKLGIHICRALELCARKNIIHRDVKPENIFISPHGDYKIGDFGVARQVERTMGGLSIKGSSMTMAPEVFKGEQYGASVDTYGLGIVMYALLNMNRAPFIPAYPQPILPDDRDTALEKRMRGEPIPSIPGISSELNALVLQSCAHGRRERFSDPAAMRNGLESLVLENLSLEDESKQKPKRGRKLAPGADGNTLHLLPEISETNSDEDISEREANEANEANDANDANDAASRPTEMGVQANPGGPAVKSSEPSSIVSPSQTTGRIDRSEVAVLNDGSADLSKSVKSVKESKINVPVTVVVGFLLVAIVGAVAWAALGPGFKFGAAAKGYGISISGQRDIDIVLNTKAEADAVIDNLKKHYSDLINPAEGTEDKVVVEIEETVEILELAVNSDLEVVTAETEEGAQMIKIMSEKEALQALIDGKTITIKHMASEGETVDDVAEKYKEDEVTIEAIIAENEGVTAEGKLEEGAVIKMNVARPYLHVIVRWIGEVIEEIEFETEQNKSDDVTLHQTKVQQEGEKGSKSLSYDHVSRNGVVVENHFRGESVIREPVTQIVLEGTRPKVVDLDGKKYTKSITNDDLDRLVNSGEIPVDVTTLILRDNNITEISSLKSLVGLTELYLEGNRITSIEPLQSLKNLAVLNLESNDITDFSPLKSLNNLKNLNIVWNPGGVIKLQDAANDLTTVLPDCEIIYLK